MKNKIDDKSANSRFGRLARHLLSLFELRVLKYYKKYDTSTLKLIQSIYKEEGGIVVFSPYELFLIHSLAQAQSHVSGNYAEVGVFRGASAKAIAEAKPKNAALHLFDTFTGLPDIGDADKRFKKAMFAYPQEKVEKRLSRYTNIHFHAGLFPKETGEKIADRKFSFVHIDVDLYQSTIDSLSFFWPRMTKGGIVISHDYSQCEGVFKAFQEFTDKHSDCRVVEMPTTQIILMKL